MRKYVDKDYSVFCLVTFKVEDVIQKCLFSFPYIWASVLVLIDGLQLNMLYLINC